MKKWKPSFSGLRPLFQIATPITKKACTKQEGFLASLLLDWPLIVGHDIAIKAEPKKIAFPRQQNKKGTVTLAVTSGADSMMVYHMSPAILTKINTFFGYEAFHYIKVVQTKETNLPNKNLTPQIKNCLSVEDENQILSMTHHIPNGPLKEALENLGRGLYLKDKTNDK